MSYSTPTPLEIRISSRLNNVAKWLGKKLAAKFGGEVDFVFMVCPKRTEIKHDLVDQPVMSYISTADRETSTLMICELLAKWQANGEIPPIHELRDANGQSLDEIIGKGLN